MLETMTRLDPIETRMQGFELVHKTCAAVLVGSIAWFIFNLHTVVPHLAGDHAGNALLARLSLVGFVIVAAVFALPLALLNSRQSWLMALAGMPLVVLAALSLAISARPLAYRLVNWSHPVNVLINVILIAGLIVFVSWVVVFVRGWLGASALIAMPSSAAYRGHHLRTSRRRIVEFMLAIPPVVTVMRRRRVKTLLLYGLHATFAGLAAFLPFALSIGIISFPSTEQQLHYSPDVRASGLGPADAVRMLWAIVFTTAAALVVVPAMIWIARRALGWAQSNVRLSMHELLETDQRRPILFLRSFRDDQVKLRARPWSMLRLLTGASNRRLLDHLATEELSTLGPVVALGAPGDPVPPYGAARGYFAHGSWQDAVLALMDRSALIVLVLDDTAGTWWEVEQVAAQPARLRKTIFLVHPEHAANGKSVDLLGRLAHLLGRRVVGERITRLPGDGKHVLGVYVASGGVASGAAGPGNGSDVVWLESTTFTEQAFSLALRDHSAAVLGGKPAHAQMAPTPEPAVTGGVAPRSIIAATLAALGLAMASAVIIGWLQSARLPHMLLGVSVRPWLATASVLLPLLVYLRVRQFAAIATLTATWIVAGWLSGNIYHAVLQMQEVRWDTFDHHAEAAAHGGMFFLVAAAMIYLFPIDGARALRVGMVLALVGAGVRWVFNSLCLAYLPISALQSPLLVHIQHFLIAWPGLVFVAIVLARRGAGPAAREQRV